MQLILKMFSGVSRSLKITTLSPREKALSTTLGFYLSLFPVAGLTTILCLLAIISLRLNAYLVQGLNLLLMPLQLILMYPMLKTGRMLFFTDTALMPKTDKVSWTSFTKTDNLLYLFESIAGGIAIWAILSVSTGFFLYRILLKFIWRL